ncbi:hypothetical protein SAMN05661086_01281 [Anaeromicropila populeti]|uniref:Methyltransferase domain-containing protein n=1 Tax=Anaeromicropila populeti TaxID=37658 RepID=A0A1I6J0K0_9FIRM|nr:hypothetical protein SAMN05661086_01281 [Anaeromicropila populeti]
MVWKKDHIDEMKGWDKGKLKIWEQRVANNFPVGAKILDIGSGMGMQTGVKTRRTIELLRTFPAIS